MSTLLNGRRILVLEDQYPLALDMKDMVEAHGATVVGPVGRVEQALELVRSERIDGAILDVRLHDHDSLPVADELVTRGIPVIFATGYVTDQLPERFANTPRIAKPFSRIGLERTLRKVFGDALIEVGPRT